jgi:hypothetical protein
MPFIVSLYKYLILAVCFLVLVGLALLVFASVDPNGPFHEEFGPYGIIIALVGVVFLIINLGAIAILISMHDRHKEIAQGIHRIALALEHDDA